MLEVNKLEIKTLDGKEIVKGVNFTFSPPITSPIY